MAETCSARAGTDPGDTSSITGGGRRLPDGIAWVQCRRQLLNPGDPDTGDMSSHSAFSSPTVPDSSSAMDGGEVWYTCHQSKTRRAVLIEAALQRMQNAIAACSPIRWARNWNGSPKVRSRSWPRSEAPCSARERPRARLRSAVAIATAVSTLLARERRTRRGPRARGAVAR